jgi:hypothetical protein
VDKNQQRKLYESISMVRKTQMKLRVHMNRVERRFKSKRTTREEKGVLLNLLKILYYIDYVLERVLTRAETLLITGIISSKDLEFVKEVLSKANIELSEVDPDISLMIAEARDSLASIRVEHVLPETPTYTELSFTSLEPDKEVKEVMDEAKVYADNKIKELVEKSIS